MNTEVLHNIRDFLPYNDYHCILKRHNVLESKQIYGYLENGACDGYIVTGAGDEQIVRFHNLTLRKEFYRTYEIDYDGNFRCDVEIYIDTILGRIKNIIIGEIKYMGAKKLFDINYQGVTFTIKNKDEEDKKNRTIYKKEMLKRMGIERVIKNDKAVIIFLEDGTKGVALCDKDDHFDPVVGLSVAYAMAVGTNSNKKQFKENVSKIVK